jgi:hypothetical protein
MGSGNESYRATGFAETIGFIVVMLLGIAVMIAVVAQFPKDINGGVAFGLMIALTLPTFGALLFYVRGMDRRRARRAAAVLGPLGFTCFTEPTVEQQTQAATTIGRMAMLAEAPAYVSWVMRRTTPAGETVVIRHARVVGSGKGARELVTMVAAAPMARPGATSGVWLTRTNFLQRRDDARTKVQDIQLGDAGLDAAFRIQAHDVGEPARVLALSGVRDLILAGPAKESWAITPDHAICIFAADTTPSGLGVMLRRAERMAELSSRSA